MLSFPLSTADFFEWLPLSSISFHLPGAYEMSETGAGETITATLGTRLWEGSATLGKMSYEEIAQAEVYLTALQHPGCSFMAYDRRRPAPASDPDGAILGGIVPTIASLAANNREMSLGNLPAGYVLSVGDYLSFSYGTAPVRQALHRVVTQVNADAGGTTPVFEVTPHIRPGASIGAAVDLLNPACKAIIVPESFDPGSNARRITQGMKFRFKQTLR